METIRLTVMLMLALCAVSSVDAQPADVMIRYKNFLEQHVFGGMTAAQCDSVIRNRKITAGNSNDCKQVNTFILATHEQVRAVCQKGGKPKGGDLYESTKPFAVVICRLRSGERRPKCVYDGKRSTRTIAVACDKEWPVHYEEDSLVIG